MEGVAAEATPPAEDGGQARCLSPEPAASARLCRPRRDGDVSDATQSVDSGDEEDPPPGSWERRRSSSSSVHSNEDMDADTLETKQFMEAYVEKVFHGRDDLDQEEKARFGALCSGRSGGGRKWFARYVSAQRCLSKRVSEATFYRLVQSFALVLFECHQRDDFVPARNLMTMCFTYFYHGRLQPSPSELLDRGAPPAGLDLTLVKAGSWLLGRRDAAERLLKNTSRTDVLGFFGGRPRSSVAKTEGGDSPPASKDTLTGCEAVEPKDGDKVYLYTHLKQQPIWHTLRFWNAAFFDAVHCERTKRSPTTREKWCHMTQEEKDDSYRMDENIAFGQLGTFTHNMLAFGLSRKLCRDFLRKQAVIGSLTEEQYKLLTDHVERMAAAD